MFSYASKSLNVLFIVSTWKMLSFLLFTCFTLFVSIGNWSITFSIIPFLANSKLHAYLPVSVIRLSVISTQL